MSDSPADKATGPDVPAPAHITIKIGGRDRQLSYEQAYVAGCELLEKGRPADAAKLFHRLEEFTDRGPRAFVMGAFCDAAAHDYDACSAQLTQAFDGDDLKLAGALHDAFISINVGIRKEGMQSLAKLVDEYKNLPTLALLLGDLVAKSNPSLAQRCWTMAVNRDRPGGAVAAAAARQLKRTAETAP